jgi:hypothetical protein
MYYVYKRTKGSLILKGTFTDESLAYDKAKKIKGIVKINNTICYNFSGLL